VNIEQQKEAIETLRHQLIAYSTLTVNDARSVFVKMLLVEMYRISGCILSDNRPLFAVRFLTVRKPDIETGEFYLLIISLIVH